jgi:hypothetical protein
MIWLSVEATSTEDAIDKALESPALHLENVHEWEAHRCVTDGNVFRGLLNEADAELD